MSRKKEEQLEKELRFHLEQHTADLMARGYSRDDACRQARIDLGGPEQVKEQCRDARSARWLSDLAQDVRYALRTLRQRPGFAAVALLTLALGTGATTVMFTVINGVLLKPLPFPQPDNLFKVDEQTKGVVDYRWGDRWAFAYPNFLDCKAETRSLVLGAFRYGGGTLSGEGRPEYVDSLEISANLFSVLGIGVSRGRGFLAQEDRPGAAPAIIISDSLWRRRYDGAPSTIGSALMFEGKAYTVVGITPPGFPLRDADVFTPIGQNTQAVMQNRGAHPGISVWARLRNGATASEANAELALIGRRLAAQYPKSNTGRGFIAEPLRPDVGDARSTLWLLLGAVSLVLLIACANIASLLLARAVSRGRELAMRVALGASRMRLVRQCLTESAVLGLCGGVLGVLLALAAIRPFLKFWPGSLPRAEEVQLDWHVLLFAVSISLLCGFLFGLAPALRVPTRELEQILRSGARTLVGTSRLLHSGFVISEIALAVVLLGAAGMLGSTLLRLSSLDAGVNVHNVLTTRMALSPSVLSDPRRIQAAWNDVLDRARHVPGVQFVAMVDTVPMRQGNNQLGYWKTPAEPEHSHKPLALASSVTPDYLKVMGMKLLDGRFFDEHDRMGSEAVIVIDEVMARHAFGNEKAVGRRLWTDLVPGPLRVAGVVDHVRYWGLASDDQAVVRDQFYYPFAQVPNNYLRRWSELMSIAVRTNIPPLSVVEPLRREMRGAGDDQVLYEVHSLEELASATLARQRFLLLLFGAFAALALLLACIGIYGVLAYVTSQRIPEFGVRMALGASAHDVVVLLLRQSLKIILIGIGVGVAGAFTAGRILAGSVDGVRSTEPLAVGAMISVLIAAALLASFVPARRASRVDPMTALRQE